MRILVLSDLPPHVCGGAETQALRLTEEWLALGHHVDVAGHRTPSGIRRVGAHNLRVHHLQVWRTGGRAGRAASYFLSLSRFLVTRRRRYDVIYCRFLSEAALSVSALKSLRVLRQPLIATPASSSAAGDVAVLRSLPASAQLVRLINRHCDAVNLIAPAMEHDLRGLGVATRRITHIPNGVPIPSACAQRPTGQPRQLLFVGRLEPQKGLDLLLSALGEARDAGAGFQVELIGDGSMRDALACQCQHLRLDDRVRFRGALPNEAALKAMDDADVFVLPSRFEGLSNAALEAMARCLPPVLTACGGIDEYVTPDTGWVVPIEDSRALADALVATCREAPERLEQMGRSARELVRDRFGMRPVATCHLELFDELVSERP